MTWNGAGAWLIFSQSRQVNFSRTVSITFHVAIRRRPPVSQSASWLGSTLQEHRIVFVHFDQLDEVLDSEVGERHHAILAEP